MADNSEIIVNDKIESLVYTIRGQQVMLDSDLAVLYGYEVRALNQQVKRNMERFPDDFMFQLTEYEYENLKSHFVISSWGGNRKLPYAFTEQGIYMLATVLKSDVAVRQSINIMRAFKKMRHYLKEYQQFVGRDEYERLSADVNDRLSKVEHKLDEVAVNFISDAERKEIVIYKGQKFEADVIYIKIFLQAKKTIYVVDNYVNYKTLELLSHKREKVSAILFTNNQGKGKGKLTDVEIEDFNEQYATLIVRPNTETHDRLIVLDYNTRSERIFHCGASSKDAGNTMCAINEISDVEMYHPIIDKLLVDKG